MRGTVGILLVSFLLVTPTASSAQASNAGECIHFPNFPVGVWDVKYAPAENFDVDVPSEYDEVVYVVSRSNPAGRDLYGRLPEDFTYPQTNPLPSSTRQKYYEQLNIKDDAYSLTVVQTEEVNQGRGDSGPEIYPVDWAIREMVKNDHIRQEIIDDPECQPDYLGTETPDEASPSEESGGFLDSVKDTISGLTSVFSGKATHTGEEITCKEERQAKLARGVVESVEGEATVNRGLQSLEATSGTALLGGDVLTVKESASATIELFGSGEMTVPEMTKFRVPKTEYDCMRNSVWQDFRYSVGDAWLRIQNTFGGGDFEVRTGTGAVGRRG